MREPLTVAAIVADIEANAEHMAAQPELAARLAKFGMAHRTTLGELVLAGLIQVMEFIEDTPEADKELAYRLGASELTRAAAMVVWGLKQHTEQPFRPSSFAVVAYEVAQIVQDSAVANDVEPSDG